MEPEPEPPGAAFFLPGAGADPSRSEPESAPGPWPSGAGAAQKSGGSATLVINKEYFNRKKLCLTKVESLPVPVYMQ